jgi:hypothetical protein
MSAEADRVACYVVTDIETDGPDPGPHSLRSFASAVLLADGVSGGTFTATLEPLAGAEPHPQTLAWFMQHPDAWEAATKDPEPPSTVMPRYAQWLRSLPWPRVFVSHPLTFDGVWIDWYLRRFAAAPLFTSFFDREPLFFGAGIDLQSLIAGRLRMDYAACSRSAYPPDWFDGHEHTHRAIDDALGYAAVLRNVLSSGVTR